ncbi:DUF2182 domain-containing protein [Thalassotalea sp. HSM 43]|uniref:DUF2182 domain-containing protein n=1 Tax=Thalassotalea sp. HSM 43 TaxID=2552945 RepID=UPI001E37176B|nr:DUF2182 domain-containing protein [Thalassotalea sp. HSM 43]
MTTTINRIYILSAIALLIYLSWYYMFYGMTMNMDPVQTWSSLDIFNLFVMWAIMMAGMMLPSALPVILLIDKVNRQKLQRQQTVTPTLFFALGYLLAWTLYSALITFIQYYLHHLELLTPMMDSGSTLFSGAIFLVAGIYQFSSLKQSCLNYCRSPLTILSNGWRQGTWPAIEMGLKNGAYCVGCCWFLMAILFVSGVMNLTWILLLTIVVIIEKSMPKGDIISKFLGAVLILLGISYMV